MIPISRASRSSPALTMLMKARNSEAYARVWRDQENGNRVCVSWIVTPEDSVCSRCVVLGVCFERLNAIGAFQCVVFMCMQAWMRRIIAQKAESLPYSFKSFLDILSVS